MLVTNLKTGFRKGEWDRVEIYFNETPDDIIEMLVEEGIVLNVAGGLLIKHPLILPFVKEVVWTTDSVMGLPKDLTEKLIQGGSIALGSMFSSTFFYKIVFLLFCFLSF
ncbi:Maf-like protein [Quillaja saponaria]|uniref:Maf-like protein n=1 Tax=Quillaja saponaria TaxID=32244 RepID=A0AAD7LYQ2_QUISA|nr:Maf-like protein [Quillaja saponaria]